MTMTYTEHWVYGKSSGPEKCLLIYVKDLKNATFKFNIMMSSISLHDRPHYTAACTVFGLLNNFYQSFKNGQCTKKKVIEVYFTAFKSTKMYTESEKNKDK